VRGNLGSWRPITGQEVGLGVAKRKSTSA